MINAVNETLKCKANACIDNTHFQDKNCPKKNYNFPFKFSIKLAEIRVEIKDAFVVPHKTN